MCITWGYDKCCFGDHFVLIHLGNSERKHSIAVYYGLLSARPNIFLTFFFKIPSLSFKQYVQYTQKLLYTNEKSSYYTLLNLWRIFFPQPKFLRRSIHFECTRVVMQSKENRHRLKLEIIGFSIQVIFCAPLINLFRNRRNAWTAR